MMGASIFVSGGAKTQSHDALDSVSGRACRDWQRLWAWSNSGNILFSRAQEQNHSWRKPTLLFFWGAGRGYIVYPPKCHQLPHMKRNFLTKMGMCLPKVGRRNRIKPINWMCSFSNTEVMHRHGVSLKNSALSHHLEMAATKVSEILRLAWNITWLQIFCPKEIHYLQVLKSTAYTNFLLSKPFNSLYHH